MDTDYSQALLDLNYNVQTMTQALTRIADLIEKTQERPWEETGLVATPVPGVFDGFQVGDTVEVIELDEWDKNYYSLGSQGRVRQISGSGLMQVNFKGSTEWVKGARQKPWWWVSAEQVKVIRRG